MKRLPIWFAIQEIGERDVGVPHGAEHVANQVGRYVVVAGKPRDVLAGGLGEGTSERGTNPHVGAIGEDGHRDV